jgi:hypothetical protein
MKTHLNIISGVKKEEQCQIFIDGKKILSNDLTKKGLNMLVTDKDMKPIKFRFYDFGNYDLNKSLLDDIKSIPNQSIVMLALKGNYLNLMSQYTKDYLKSTLKCVHLDKLTKKQAWIYVGRKFSNIYMNIIEKTQEQKVLINNFCDLTFKNTESLPNINYGFNLEKALQSPIKLKTKLLKQQLKNIPKHDMLSRLQLLHNQYQGATCFIISCGPSVNHYNPELLRRIAGHNLVFTIKQAYTKFSKITDFHLFNFCNLSAYTYQNNTDVITAYMSQDRKFNNNVDLNFSLSNEYILNKVRSQQNKYPPISKIMNFESYTMDKIVNRPEGPGIMYELGIYLALHLGVKEIVTLGWDLSYSLPKSVTTPNGTITDKIKESHFYGSNKHTSDNIRKIINENTYIIKSSKVLNKWLNYRGIQLYVLSEMSKLDESIPRIDANKLYKYIENEKYVEYSKPINPVNTVTETELKKYFKIDTLSQIFQFIQIIPETKVIEINKELIKESNIEDNKKNMEKQINKSHNFSRIKIGLIEGTNLKRIESQLCKLTKNIKDNN